MVRLIRSTRPATLRGEQRWRPTDLRRLTLRRPALGGIAVALALCGSAAYGFWDLCSNYSNPSYEAHENMVKDYFFDTCLELTDNICYTCIASTDLEPNDPDRDYVHCAEDQPGNEGVCERYESWLDLQETLNSRIRHRTQ